MKRIKDPKYIKWLHFQECLVCGRIGSEDYPNHPHHMPSVLHTRRGDDTLACSLCPEHHTGRTGVHSYPELEDLLKIKQKKQRARYERSLS